MKKTLIRTALFTLTAIVLSSCLGSTKFDIKQNNTYAYIKRGTESNPSLIYAVVPAIGGTIRSAELDGERPGTCAYVSFSITSNASSDGMYTADYFIIEKVLDKSIFYRDAVVPGDANLALSGFQVNYQLPSSYMDDHWFVGYKLKMKKNDVLQVFVYYDADDQIDRSSETPEIVGLEKNKVIIDLKFKLIEGEKETEGETAKEVNLEKVINFQELRDMFKQATAVQGTPVLKDSQGNAVLAVKLRYTQVAAKENEAPTKKYYGTWGHPENGIYYDYTNFPAVRMVLLTSEF